MTTLSMSFPSKLFGANESGCLNGRCREKKESRPGCHWWRDDIVAQGREAQLASIRLAFKQLMARQTVMHVVNKQLLYSWTNHSLMVGSDRLTVFVCIHLRWCISSSWLSFASSTLAIRIGYPHNVRQQQQQRPENANGFFCSAMKTCESQLHICSRFLYYLANLPPTDTPPPMDLYPLPVTSP